MFLVQNKLHSMDMQSSIRKKKKKKNNNYSSVCKKKNTNALTMEVYGAKHSV